MNELEHWETRCGPEGYVFGTAPNALPARRQAEDRGTTLAFKLSESHPLSSRHAANHRDVT